MSDFILRRLLHELKKAGHTGAKHLPYDDLEDLLDILTPEAESRGFVLGNAWEIFVNGELVETFQGPYAYFPLQRLLDYWPDTIRVKRKHAIFVEAPRTLFPSEIVNRNGVSTGADDFTIRYEKPTIFVSHLGSQNCPLCDNPSEY